MNVQPISGRKVWQGAKYSIERPPCLRSGRSDKSKNYTDDRITKFD